MGCDHLEKWMAGKPLLIAWFGQMVALGSDDAFALLDFVQSPAVLEAMGDPPELDEWLRFYRDHTAMMDGVLEVLPIKLMGDRVSMQDFKELKDGIGDLKRNAPQLIEFFEANPSDWVEFLRACHDFGQVLSVENAKFREEMMTEQVPEELQRLSLSEIPASLRFFMCVWVPCWLEYGEMPGKLFHRARHLGHESERRYSKEKIVETLENLVKLDPLVLNEPRIAKRWRAMATQRNEAAKLIQEATWNAPWRNRKRERFKVSMAAMMSRLGEVTGFRLDAPEIRALFDAVVRDQGTGLRDLDLPEGDAALAKAIQRNRPFWAKMFRDPDKKGS